MEIEQKSSTWKTTATNFAGIATAVGVVIGVYYTYEEKATERKKEDAREVMREEMQAADLLTATAFHEYVAAEKAHRIEVEAFTLEYMASVDSALVLVLPSLAQTDAEILRQISLLATKVDAQKAPSTDVAMERVWKYLEAQRAQDSTTQRHTEVMQLLRQINERKLATKSGDRIQ